MGVVVGTIIGLIVGSLFLLVSYIKQAGLHWPTFIIPQEMAKLLILGILAIFLSNYGRDQQSSLVMVSCVTLLCASVFLVFSFNHPNRKMLMGFQ
jgi:hypothetical protein